MVTVPPACRPEILALPDEVRGDLADAIARLEEGLMLSMPLSRPMSAIGRGAHELRLKDRSGAYRVVYAVGGRGQVVLVHAFKKTTRTTPRASIRTARTRLRESNR